jgi:hypothetical protein
MTIENLEKTLKRLTWLVSVTALVAFGSVSAYYYNKSSSAHKGVLIYINMQRDVRKECSIDTARCPMLKTIESWITDSERRRDEADKQGFPFIVLTLAAPLTLWFLFFSSVWVLTGRKPWQRQGLLKD